MLGVALTPGRGDGRAGGRRLATPAGLRPALGGPLPRVVEATLPDGARLKLTVEDAETGVDLPEAAFADPPSPGYRAVDAQEARSLWGGS